MAHQDTRRQEHRAPGLTDSVLRGSRAVADDEKFGISFARFRSPGVTRHRSVIDVPAQHANPPTVSIVADALLTPRCQEPAKIATALPHDKRAALESSRLFSPGFCIDPQLGQRMDAMRTAIDGRRRLELDYRDNGGRESTRCVQPLGLFFWGGAWTLGAWCELRSDFRNFRLDRIVSCVVHDTQFADAPGRRLADYLRAMSVEK